MLDCCTHWITPVLLHIKLSRAGFSVSLTTLRYTVPEFGPLKLWSCIVPVSSSLHFIPYNALFLCIDILHSSKLKSCMIFAHADPARYHVMDSDVRPLCSAVTDAPRPIIQASDTRRARLKYHSALMPASVPQCTHLPLSSARSPCNRDMMDRDVRPLCSTPRDAPRPVIQASSPRRS
jgi:hypothetical protein